MNDFDGKKIMKLVIWNEKKNEKKNGTQNESSEYVKSSSDYESLAEKFNFQLNR